ncbi:hypothetical protein LTR53_001233 [Teratosphaeriaceae sp. CCFEE 6253]|nr:hypothetical protein LTR53_001233 [Teratosphaeriaceae sp. CCFEE 6253]
MGFLCSLPVLGLVASCLAAPTTVHHVVHEKRSTSGDWLRRDRVHEDVKLPMRIGLTQTNLDKGHDLLMEVSNHASPKYGKYYSAEDVIDIFAPAKASVSAVQSWLASAGVDATLSVNKQWLQFDAKTSEVEELLKTEYHFYEHSQTGKGSIACAEYKLPAHVRSHVDYITPGIKLYSPGAQKLQDTELQKRTSLWRKPHRPRPPPVQPMPPGIPYPPANLDHCDTVATPQCIAALYNITKGHKAARGNQLGIFEDLGDYYSQSDLNLFFANATPYIPQGTHPKLEAIDGAVVPSLTNGADAGPESNLDFMISYPIIWPQQSVLFQTDDPVVEANYTYSGFFNNFLDAIDGSYCTYSAFGKTGNSPIDPPYPDPLPGGYKGALQCGVYKPTNVISISYGGQEADAPVNYQKRQCNEFLKLGLHEEVAVTRFPSGGGFSNIYPIPSYQASAVAGCFRNHNPSYPYYETVNNASIGANGGIYNRIGRGYPDFAAIGDNVMIYLDGVARRIGGTSASSPAFAAILTRINEERLAVGKSTIGFVNPTLYAHPQVLHDITVGNNSGCGTPGFYAASGWDPVTGLGTPNYPAMLKLFLSLP